MFFSKKNKTESDKQNSDWSISEKGVKNNLTGHLYDIGGLSFSSRIEGSNTLATLWYQNKYLCNLTIPANQSDLFRNYYISECDDFINDFTEIKFNDHLNNEIKLSIPVLTLNSKNYGLCGLRTQSSKLGCDLYTYGNYLTTVDESYAKVIEEAKDISLARQYGIIGSKTKEQLEKSKRNKAEQEKIKSIMQSDILLTTETAPNFNITKRIDIITAECVYGMNIFKDIFASFTDVFGGRSDSIQSTLRDARKTALAELRKEAASIGANAVIGVDLDYSEISGGGKSGMLFIVASGTAVIIDN